MPGYPPCLQTMSNPTAITEAVPADIHRWTDGRALIATGSPFEPIETPQGPQRVGQANNVFVFPGIGLGTIVAGAREITDGMISAAANALADSLGDAELERAELVPTVSRLWDVCGQVAVAVAEQAIEDGVATGADAADVAARIAAKRWRPAYPEIVGPATSP